MGKGDDGDDKDDGIGGFSIVKFKNLIPILLLSFPSVIYHLTNSSEQYHPHFQQSEDNGCSSKLHSNKLASLASTSENEPTVSLEEIKQIKQ